MVLNVIVKTNDVVLGTVFGDKFLKLQKQKIFVKVLLMIRM